MLLKIHISPEKPVEQTFAKRLSAVLPVGWRAETVPNGTPVQDDDDLIVFIGVKSHKTKRAAEEAGKPYAYVDKPYNRDWPSWLRVCLNAQHPVAYFDKLVGVNHSRAAAQGWNFPGWKATGDAVLLAGASEKYHTYNDLPGATQWAELTIRQIRKYTDRPIIYRPKPSWNEATPIPGSEFSQGKRTIQEELKRCRVVVTHGSVAALDAVLAGVPVISLGQSPMHPVCRRDLCFIEDPIIPMVQVQPMLDALAFCQFSTDEVASGHVGRHLEQILSS